MLIRKEGKLINVMGVIFQECVCMCAHIYLNIFNQLD